MRRHQGLFDRPHGRAQRGWDDGYDPTMEYYDQSNVYRRGPGAYLAAEHQPYNIQPGAQPYKLFISGVHPHTSEDGILNIFREYGTPISVFKTRNNFNEPIAFVEFASQREADSAIINLDRKPPLHWSVTYATSRKERYDPLSDLNEVILGEIERQTPLHLPSSAAVVRRTAAPTYPGPILGDSSSPVRRREEENLSLYPPCTVCTTPAKLVCIVCKTRYCSESCQSGDWPTHRNQCIPPPVLQLAQPAVNNVAPMRVPSTATVTELPAPIRGTRANPNLSAIQVIRERDAESLVNPQPSAIQGIRTMTINDGPSPSEITRTIPNAEITRTIPNAVNSNVPPPTMNSRPSPNFKSNGASPRDQQPYARTPQGNFNAGRSAGPPARNLPIQRMSPQMTPPNKPGILGVSPGSGGRINQMQTNSPNNVVEPPRQTKIYAHVYQNAKLTTPPPNVPAMVNLCFVKSPSDFYIQYKRYSDELEELMASIQDSAIDASPLPATPAEMSPCLAIFPEDRKWYRAKVIKLFDDGIGVLFVDYGNTKKLTNTRDSLRQMEDKFSKAPFYAIRAKLVDVMPLDGTNAWPQPIKDKFKQLMEFNDFNMARVREEEDGTMCVRLTDNGTDIGQMLVSKGAAKSTIASTSPPSDELDPVSRSVPATPQQPVASKPKEPEPALSVVPAGAAAPGPTPVPPAGRLPSMSAAALLRARMKPIQPVPDSSTDTRSIVKQLKPGDSVALAIATAWGETNSSAGYLVRSSEPDDGKAMDYHEVVAGSGNPLVGFNLAVGSLISALSPEHGQWFRGCILEVTPSSYSVLYIDYGNVEKGVVSVKPIPDNYKESELAVKLSVGGSNITPETKKYAAQNFIPDAALDLEILTVESDGAVMAKLKNTGALDIRIKLEPWAALFEQLKAQQSLPQQPAPPLEIKYRPLEAGFSGDVAVQVAEGVDRIFAQLVSNEAYAAITKVDEILNDLFQKTKAPETAPAVGTYVAAIFEDGGFYRARVTAVDGNQLTLEYIDYGNTWKVELSQIRVLSKEACDIPCSTYQLSLSLTRRPDGPLFDAVKALLNSLIGQISSILVLKYTDGVIECTLTKGGQVINESISKLLEPPAPPAVQAAAPMMPKLETAAPEETGEPVDNTLGNFSYQDGPFQKLPQSGLFQALVLTVDTPPLMTICPVEMDMLNKLAQLDEDIASYVGSLPLMKYYEPKDGEVFLARSPVDSYWYRCTCMQTCAGTDGAKFECLQLDYGKSMVITKESILRIPKRLVTFMPYVALMAVMKDFAATFEVTEKVGARLKELVAEGTQIDMSVISFSDDIYTVDIPSVSSQLKAEGLI